jgi:hypothetical protein
MMELNLWAFTLIRKRIQRFVCLKKERRSFVGRKLDEKEQL